MHGMSGNSPDSWKWLDMDGNGWKVLKMADMANVAINGLIGIVEYVNKWLETAGMVGNGCI